MSNKNGWGDGASNNKIGWGQGANNYIGWGSSELVSYEGLTNIVGAFTTEWTTIANSEQIALPYIASGTYSGTIYWGDGSTSINDGGVVFHTYATAGTYTVIITGDCIGWDIRRRLPEDRTLGRLQTCRGVVQKLLKSLEVMRSSKIVP